jgi:ketosteroid isomerase-like protein
LRRWLAKRLIQRAYTALREHDPAPVLRLFRPGARFHFAGDHSWAIDTTDPAAIRAWFERFATLGPHLRAQEVVVGGPPWRMSVCVVFDDSLADETGNVVYHNHGVQYLRLRWGRVVLDEVSLDTQKVADYDAQLLNNATR